MKQRDYERLAEQCSAQADAMQPGPERDALLERFPLDMGHYAYPACRK
jgi:hypothetical protein